MTTLYNCKHDGDQFRITKFDSDMNVESSYLCTVNECECPAGVRDSCRHRQMLPRFIQRDHIGDDWFYDFDRGGWVQVYVGYLHRVPDAACATDSLPQPQSGEAEPSLPQSVAHPAPFNRRGL